MTYNGDGFGGTVTTVANGTLTDSSNWTVGMGGSVGWTGYPTWYCSDCGSWAFGSHYHEHRHCAVVHTEAARYSCGTADHDYAQLKQPTGGKPRLFCRRCGTTRNV